MCNILILAFLPWYDFIDKESDKERKMLNFIIIIIEYTV